MHIQAVHDILWPILSTSNSISDVGALDLNWTPCYGALEISIILLYYIVVIYYYLISYQTNGRTRQPKR